MHIHELEYPKLNGLALFIFSLVLYKRVYLGASGKSTAGATCRCARVCFHVRVDGLGVGGQFTEGDEERRFCDLASARYIHSINK